MKSNILNSLSCVNLIKSKFSDTFFFFLLGICLEEKIEWQNRKYTSFDEAKLILKSLRKPISIVFYFCALNDFPRWTLFVSPKVATLLNVVTGVITLISIRVSTFNASNLSELNCAAFVSATSEFVRNWSELATYARVSNWETVAELTRRLVLLQLGMSVKEMTNEPFTLATLVDQNIQIETSL